MESGHDGVGVVCRDHQGMCKVAIARPIPFVDSALHTEAEACRAGLLLAIHQEWEDVELELDSSVLVSALANNNEDGSRVGRVYDDFQDHFGTPHFVKQMVWCIA